MDLREGRVWILLEHQQHRRFFFFFFFLVLPDWHYLVSRLQTQASSLLLGFTPLAIPRKGRSQSSSGVISKPYGCCTLLKSGWRSTVVSRGSEICSQIVELPNKGLTTGCSLMSYTGQVYGHVRRMDTGCIPKNLLYGELAEDIQPVGYPLLRFKDVCQSNLKQYGIAAAM